ncbi:aldehyde dehydrogenase family protein [Georgenia faecalis]|uniref:Aldehyde dehydrogenase family protein n=1 Tax=Georgenia faecalis TaxID=2483799 RepID=A0ABV9DBW0_9MICO|nr:aldehyde dehydrogenase family protein [Georgenia faecalis]
MEHFLNLIDGRWTGEPVHPDVNPSSRRDVLGLSCQAGAHDVDEAAAAARRAQPGWARTSHAERAAILARVADRIARDAGTLARTLAREEGKTLAEATGEVTRAAGTFRYFADALLQPVGEVYQGLQPGTRVHTVRRPVGVVGVITPWNFPIAIPAWKVAPALAFGNAVVFKPADLVPATAFRLARILDDCGVPAGVFNLVAGPGATVGARIATCPDIDAVTFTGSTAVGTSLAGSAVTSGLKKVQLEMGGKNALLVMEDADLDAAAQAACDGAFGATGQRCTAASRLLVHTSVHDEFVDRLAARIRRIVVGPALDPATTMGPVVSESQLASDLEGIAAARAEGAELAVGGNVVEDLPEGNFLRPALFTGTTARMPLNREELFGPVAAVVEVAAYEEALAVANDVDYGLSAAIFTSSLPTASHFQRHSEAGMIMINRSTAATDLHVPFGGMKASSYGAREQGRAAQDFFTTLATVYTAGETW